MAILKYPKMAPALESGCIIVIITPYIVLIHKWPTKLASIVVAGLKHLHQLQLLDHKGYLQDP